jgi:hypothetical protein
MPQVLTANATVLCPHGGKGTSTPSAPTAPRCFVRGGQVLVENDTGVLACPNVPVPCVGYTLRSMGLNSSRIAGRRILLVTDFNTTVTGLPLMMTEAHTTIDDSTLTPVPAGEAAPSLSPAMADPTSPIVTASQPALAFNSISMQPPTLTASFTLAAAFPLARTLTLINEPKKTHTDVTNGAPPGLVVSPTGGEWAISPLTVTIVLTADFMAALTPGTHRFYMTGTNQRGRSAFAQVVLTVT